MTGPRRAWATIAALRGPVASITTAGRPGSTHAHRQGGGITFSSAPNSRTASAFVTGWSSTRRVGAAANIGDGRVVRLVEADVAVAADPQQLEVEAAVGFDPAVELGRVLVDERLGDRAVRTSPGSAGRSTRPNRCRCI